MIRWLFFRVLLLALLGSAFWLVGFVCFYMQVPAVKEASGAPKADAIAVLTGDSGRLEYGLELMEANKARWLFVSGVNKRATKEQIFEFATRRHSVHYERYKHQIILGFDAKDTIDNAKEVRTWMQDMHFGSLLLVTSDYHMPRSLVEFKRHMPRSIELIPMPSASHAMDESEREKSIRPWRSLMQEYHKYVASLISPYAKPVLQLMKEYT